jgi:hypothetical protein
MNILKQLLAVSMSALLLWAIMPPAAEGAAVPPRQEAYANLSDGDLDALVAPISLYPDALVAQVLGAATYPDQVEEADTYIKANYNLTGEALVQAAAAKGWDPSVQALVQFPSVLDKLSKNIAWTSALGDASANQQADVMAAIQRMRAKAYAAGNLKSGEQIKVVQESPQVIVIQSASPQVIYVPTYNPTVVYGTTVVTPGYSSGDVAAAAIVSFGVGVAVGAMISNSSCGYSYWGWRMSWGVGTIYCGSVPYYGNPYWWGGYYPGYRPGYRPPYYPPPRPPRPPPPGWRPPPGGGRPPYPPPGGKPPAPQPKPTPLPAKPGGPTSLPAQPGVPGAPATRPTTRPTTQPSTRELRGYPSAPTTKPAPKPNAFSGSGGGRPESARGNRSMSAPAPSRAPSGGKTKR